MFQAVNPPCVLFFRPLISRNIWLKGPFCRSQSSVIACDKRASAGRLQDYPQDNPPGTIHPPIIHTGILDSLSGIDPGTNNELNYHRVPVPSRDRRLGQWAICGSGAGFLQRSKGKMSSDGEGFMEAYTSMAKPSYTEETLNLSMTANQPPLCDGKVSWFRYEELVDDWVTITTVEASKRGPLLKSRLTGDAYMYKAVLQNDLSQDPDEGVNYFKNTLKEYFLKGARNVYLYRLLSFFYHRRQNQEFLTFTSKFEILLMRLKAAWMDLMPIFTHSLHHFDSPYRTQMQEQLLDISKQPVFEHRLQPCSMRTIRQSSDSISKECRTDSGTHFPSRIISLHSFSLFKVSCQISNEKD